MHSFFYQIWKRIKYLNFALGRVKSLRLIIKKLIVPIYKNESGYIIVRLVDLKESPLLKGKAEDMKNYDFEIVNTLQGFASLENEIPKDFYKKRLKKHIANTSNRFIIFIIKPTGNKKKEIIGYRTCSRGHFKDFGMSGNLPLDILVINHTEVVPKYRGKRVHQVIRAITFEYCQRENIKKIVGIVRSHNLPSLLAHTRFKADKIVGKVETISIFGQRYRKSTSFANVKQIIEEA